MAAPKLKLYALPPNYTQGTDNDIQQRNDDELLPVLPKNEALNNVSNMSGVWPWFEAKCYPLNVAAGRTSSLLSQQTGLRYRPAFTPLANILVEPSGQLAVKVLDADNTTVIPPSGYNLRLDQFGLFDAIEFVTLPITNKFLSFWQRDTAITPANYALPASSPYDGANPSLNKLVVYPSGGNWPNINQPLLASAAGPSGAYVTLPSGATSMTATFWSKDPNSYWFTADQPNWIKDHMRMNPDIFIGTKDYPGDNGEVNGTPFVQGPVPQFQDIGTYQVNYRDGYVKFTQRVNSATLPVTGNFARLVGIKNVTRMRLTVVPNSSGRVWRPSIENVFPEAHSKRVVRRNDQITPLNVYVNGALASQPRSVSPYEVLQPKLS